MSLIILTVGTGVETRNNKSDVRFGLLATLDKIKPRAIWLVPSSSDESTASADIIRESLPIGLQEAFQYWDADLGLAYRCIPDPDNLEDCRQTVRGVICKARTMLEDGERLIINPTSGTKQMSAGATLAALDEGIGDIQFTVGERQDGVVMTGTEEITTFDSSRYFEDRDLATAEELFKAGAYSAAAKVLKRHKRPHIRAARTKALCMHEWHRLNHSVAAQHAEKFSPQLTKHLQGLDQEPEISAIILRDLLASADELRKWGDLDEALARYYRAAELAAKVILADGFNVIPSRGGADGYEIDKIEALLSPNCEFVHEIKFKSRGRRSILLGLDQAWRLLDELGHEAGKSYFENRKLRDALDKRNFGLYGHGNWSAKEEDVSLVRAELESLFRNFYPAFLWSDSNKRLYSLMV